MSLTALHALLPSGVPPLAAFLGVLAFAAVAFNIALVHYRDAQTRKRLDQERQMVGDLHQEIAQAERSEGLTAAHKIINQAYERELRDLSLAQQAQAETLHDDPKKLAQFLQQLADRNQGPT